MAMAHFYAGRKVGPIWMFVAGTSTVIFIHPSMEASSSQTLPTGCLCRRRPMPDMAHFLDIDDAPLKENPLFLVEEPDGKRNWPEIDRQATLFSLMRQLAPKVKGWATANAGKRNPFKAKKEGILGGVFDTEWVEMPPLHAWVELKGYDASGRPGKLSAAQIEWGNAMHKRGYPVACFFDPYCAADWLREQGFSVRPHLSWGLPLSKIREK